MKFMNECVCVLGTRVSCAKTAEPIEMPFGADSCGPKEPCIRCGSRSPRERAILGVARPSEKHWESLMQCVQQKGSFSCQ